MAIAVAEVTMPPRRTPEGIRMGEEIEAIRREGPFTQQQIADRLEMSLQGYLNYRRGYGKLTRNTLPKWAKALDVPITALARRLRIDLLIDADPEAPALRRELAALIPDADAAELDDIFRRLSALPPSDRRQIIDGLADHVTGREHRLARD